MRFPAFAISLAALAAVILVAYADAPGRSLATSPPSAQRFSIDMDPAFVTANTATSLGSRESCAAINWNGVLDRDEDFVDTVEFDVTVTGIPASNAMMGYAYTLNYPSLDTMIVGQQPMLIGPPAGILNSSDSLPDSSSPFNVSVVDPSGPAESGSGVLDRLRIETNPGAVAGVFRLTLDNAAHVDTSGTAWAPDALDNAIIEVNASSCGLLIDIEMVSMSLTSANPILVGMDAAVTASESIRNNSPYSGNTDALTTFNVPSGCTLNNQSGTVVINPGLGVLTGGSSINHQETPTLRCTAIGSFQMPVTACGVLNDPMAGDPVGANDCLTQNLNFDVAVPPGDADSDGVWDLDEGNCGVSTSGPSAFPERLNGLDDDGDTEIDEALPAGSEAWDCDGDGYVGTAEAHVFGPPGSQVRCGPGAWPGDFVSGGVPDSTNRINILDFVSFLTPTRHLNTNLGDNPGDVRWDLVPGRGPFMFDINVTDLVSLMTLQPAMFMGARAFNGPACTA